MSVTALLRYLFHPLRAAPLILIVLFSALLTVAELMGMWGVPTFAIVGSWFLKYGFVLLDHVIEGRDPPVLSAEMANPVEQRPFGLFLLLVLFYTTTEALRSLVGDALVATLRLLLLAIVPAMVASMSANGRFIDALNPAAVFGTIARIPLAYASLLIAIGALWLIATWVLRSADHSLTDLWRIESFLPGTVLATIGMQGVFAGMLRMMVLMYLWLAMFACIGGTIYERRKELSFDAANAPERIAARADAELKRQRDRIMDGVFAEVRGGAFANAGATVRKLIEQGASPLEECRWIYAHAATATDRRLADYVAQLLLAQLLASRFNGEALNIARERLESNNDFRPQTSGQLLQLIRLARDAGDRALSQRLFADFERHYPSDSMRQVVIELHAEMER